MLRLVSVTGPLAILFACAPSSPTSDGRCRNGADSSESSICDATADEADAGDADEGGQDEIEDQIDDFTSRPDVNCDPDPDVPVWSGCEPDAGESETFQVYRPPSPVTIEDPADCGAGCRQLSPVTTSVPIYDVWSNIAAFMLGSPATELYFARLDSGEVLQLDPERPDLGEKFIGHLTISDGRITYATAESAIGGVERQRLWSYDTRTFLRTLVTEWDRPLPTSPSDDDPTVWLLDGYLDRIVGVWAAVPGSNVFLLDLCKSEMRPVGPFNCCVGGWDNPPQVWEDTVVVDGDPTGRLEVFVYDDRTGLTRSLSAGAAEQSDSAIHGRLVVWTDSRNGTGEIFGAPNNLDIYGMDLDEGVEFPVTLHPANQQYADVYGCRVVWEDTRDDAIDPHSVRSDSNVNIYMLDMASGEEVRLTDWPGWESQPRIWGSRALVIGYPFVGRGRALFVIDLDARE